MLGLHQRKWSIDEMTLRIAGVERHVDVAEGIREQVYERSTALRTRSRDCMLKRWEAWVLLGRRVMVKQPINCSCADPTAKC